MSHGYIDDVPGHYEWKRRFCAGQFCDNLWDRTKVRYGLLWRLISWKWNIRKLRKIYPEKPSCELENILVYSEVIKILRAIERT